MYEYNVFVQIFFIDVFSNVFLPAAEGKPDPPWGRDPVLATVEQALP